MYQNWKNLKKGPELYSVSATENQSNLTNANIHYRYLAKAPF